MAIEGGVYQLLRNDPAVSSYVSGRIFGSRMPKDTTLPAIVWTIVVTNDVYSVQGSSGFRIKRFQFDSYAKKYIDSVKTSDAIRALLQSFSGILPDGSSVNGCIVVRDMDFPYEPGVSGYIHRRLLEIDVMYTEFVLPFTPPNIIFPTEDDLFFTEVDDEGEA